MKNLLILITGIFIIGVCACGLISVVTILSPSQAIIPTSVSVAEIPTSLPATFTPVPIRTFPTHENIDQLARNVAGDRLISLSTELITQYKGQTYPDGRVGYDIDMTLSSPKSRSREEMLKLAYNLMREFYLNYEDKEPMYLVLHLRGNDSFCTFGLGIGYRAYPRFILTDPPHNFEIWFKELRISKYYADLPEQTELNLAYANDPTSQTACDINEWKRE